MAGPSIWGIESWISDFYLDMVKAFIICFFLVTALLYFAVVLKIYLPIQKKVPQNSSILLITAHPDDECMFFAPFLLALVKTNVVHVLCVTAGNYYHQGTLRKKEILESCRILGIPKQNVEVLDSSAFPDDPNAQWDLDSLQQTIELFVNQIHPEYVFSFDQYGVSGHINHMAVSNVTRKLFSSKDKVKDRPVLYQLESVSLLRKYISLLDLPFSLLSKGLTFVSPVSSIVQAQRAMYAHRSQFVWFRALYIIASRYMIINTFIQES